jgi:hypothetical protein
MKSNIVLSTVLAFAGLGGYAHAGTFTFNFGALTGLYSSSANGATQAIQIAAQLTTQLRTAAGCSTCTITATSPTYGADAVIDKTYTGEGFAVGPTSGLNNTGSVVPETLGDIGNGTTVTSDSQFSYTTLHNNGFNTQFLSNTNDSSQQGFCGSGGTSACSEISFQFSGLTITGASFNFEVFPSAGTTGFEFEAGNHTNGTDAMVMSQMGVKPCTTVGGCGAGSGTDGNSVRSTNDTVETNAQYIGSWSDITGGTGPLSATELDFVDWPPTIGISNLTISFNTPPGVPEPSSVLLLATACIGVVLSLRRKFSRLS